MVSVCSRSSRLLIFSCSISTALLVRSNLFSLCKAAVSRYFHMANTTAHNATVSEAWTIRRPADRLEGGCSCPVTLVFPFVSTAAVWHPSAGQQAVSVFPMTDDALVERGFPQTGQYFGSGVSDGVARPCPGGRFREVMTGPCPFCCSRCHLHQPFS